MGRWSYMEKIGNSQLQKCFICNIEFGSLKELKEHKEKDHSL